MRRAFAAAAAIVVALTMTGCAGFSLDSPGSDGAAATAETQPLETDTSESTESPDAESTEGSNEHDDQMFREQVSTSGSQNLLNEEVQDHGISVAKSICEQLEAGVPMESIADHLPEATGDVELTDDDLFAVIMIGVPIYCSQYEDALFGSDD